MGYFQRIVEVSKSILIGMNVTLKHMLTPSTVVTRQYVGLKKPKRGVLGKTLGLTELYRDKEELERERYYRPGPFLSEVKPVDYLPDRHRGLHYLETEKCIMCFQCSRACPVDCIDIEGTRDGPIAGAARGDRVTLTRFTIDYSLCIFCDHCTLACPDKQKCIIMGKEFDLSSDSQGALVKNLLTDESFNQEDRSFVLEARAEIQRYAEDKAAKRKAAAEAKKKAAAAKKAAAKKEAAPKAEAKKPEPKAEAKPAPEAKKPEAKKPEPKKAEAKPEPKAEKPADKAPEPKAEKKPEPKAEKPAAKKPEPKAEAAKPEPEAGASPADKPEAAKDSKDAGAGDAEAKDS